VGPGAKAGGPNYVAQLGTWRDDDGPLTWRADEDWWAEEFAAEHDPTGLVCESNVFRYRAISPFPLRVGPGASPADVARVLAAIDVVGSKAHVSRATDEDASTFWGRMRDERPARVRLLGTEPVPVDLPVTIYVDARPVVRNGRIELARYLHEQAVSTTLHRYGNLTRR
jgi:RHH-type proline utilization regulon transcriptional repressor/proline dehydrogenase/delta 1-pyrroline-5-carboxylate dehydrogenase